MLTSAIEDSEDGSVKGSEDNESEEKDNGGEGSSTAPTSPPAPESIVPNEDIKDVAEAVEEDEISEVGESEVPPEPSAGEVSFPSSSGFLSIICSSMSRISAEENHSDQSTQSSMITLN
jgi:hypothetical protein